MRLLNSLRLLLKGDPPTTGVSQGAVYYDTVRDKVRVHDAADWRDVHQLGVPNPISATYPAFVPDGHQVLYFDVLRNDGVLTIEGNGTIVGIPAS